MALCGCALRRKLIVMGTSGHSAVVIDLARSAGYDVIGCVGPGKPEIPLGDCPYLGDDSLLDAIDRSETTVAIGVGSTGIPDVRARLFEMVCGLGIEVPNLVHPRATLAQSVKTGSGCQIMAGAILQPCVTLGSNVIVNTGAIIEHHSKVGDHVHIAPGAAVCGSVTIETRCHIGANATVLQNLTIGDSSIIGAGAVVTRNTGVGSILRGIPAR